MKTGDIMNEQLLLLLKKIELKEDYYPLFESGLITKVEHFKKNDRYLFHIEIDDYLPTEIYDLMFSNIKSCFPSSDDVDIKFAVRKHDYQKMKLYFIYVLQKVLGMTPLIEIYRECDMRTEENKLCLVVANKAEKSKITNSLKEIVDFFEKLGFKDIKIEVLIDFAKGAAILVDDEKPIIIKKEKKEKKAIIGNEIKETSQLIESITKEVPLVVIEGMLFGVDFFETRKNNFKIITLKLTDFSNSMYAKIFVNKDELYNELKKDLKVSGWYKIKGSVKYDNYAKELILNVRDINIVEKEEEIVDLSAEKRVELHTHSFMSQMDGLSAVKDIIAFAKKLGHKAVAITDHNSVQSFPEAYNEIRYGKDDFKVIFGCEMVMIDDQIKIISQKDDRAIDEVTFVVFDFETTGFNAGANDQIIEIGAVKIKNGEIIDQFSELINPGKPLPAIITDITKITDAMLVGMPSEEEVIRKFIAWFGDCPLVAHNAKFDLSFLERAYKVYNLGEFKNTLIDTLELSRAFDSSNTKHSLSALVKRYNIPFAEDEHHRAEYDAKATALVFAAILKKLISQNYQTISSLDNLVSEEDVYKFGRSYHINILCKNRDGLKNLFKLVSYANTDYLYKSPRILRSKVVELRENLLIGSGCYLSEVFVEARSQTTEDLRNIISFYDFVEIQPIDMYDHLLQMGEFADTKELVDTVKKIVNVADEAGVMVVATGDVHHLKKEDRLYREIVVNQKVPGGGLHPLARSNIKKIPSAYFRTTEEMLNAFSFLGEDKAYQIVVENTNLITDQIEKIKVILDTDGIPFTPTIENSDQQVRDIVYREAYKIYGDPLPEIVLKRIEDELKGIIGGKFDVIYLICHKLVTKSNEDGYLVGSRGSVGSSLVATLMGLTEVNPLEPHYLCPKCHKTIFVDGYDSGYDLPLKKCEKCQVEMLREGQNMPFATFLGFNADKVPDIDLNFSGEYQARAHEYTRTLFGPDNVFRAGTIGTVADKTAYGFVRGFLEDKNLTMRSAEIERLAIGCTGVKRTTGQHPGGIIVIPHDKEIFDFTPYQFPADDVKASWRTTHFDYHAIDESLVKLDILGHDDPTMLKMLGDLSKLDVTKLNITDDKIMKMFSSPKVLGVTSDDIFCETGTLGVPEFGTKFVIAMLMDTKPKTFGELVKISGLSHGTDVWLGNAQELIKNNVCPFKDVIGCRDDIMVYLIDNDLDAKDAFQIMEFVRKGKPSKELDKWRVFEKKMEEKKIPRWYIDSCYKIKYMFPKAHAVAYVISALRIAWFKVHKPIYYYAAYFSVRCHDFDVDALLNGYKHTRNLVNDLFNRGSDLTNKEVATLEVMHVALEAMARGIKFAPIDVEKSDAMNFIVLDDNTLLPPFRILDGLGEQVANKIVSERIKKPFLSIEDLQKRGKVNATTIEKMRFMGMLDHLDESSQMTLF